MLTSFKQLVEEVKNRPRVTIVVAQAADDDVLNVARTVSEMGLANFIFVGDRTEIERLAGEKSDSFQYEIVDEKEHAAIAAKAVELIKDGKGDVIMKGNLHTGVFLKAVLNKEKGFNTGKLISQISVFSNLKGDGFLMMTDCAINIAPDLQQKKQLIENAVELSQKLGVEKPRVAVLSAVEVINEAMPDTLEAAVLSKMADRGQIKNAFVDGPLALDNAISEEAARYKGITGEVAGKADIILSPTLIASNSASKAMTFFAEMEMASVIMGAAIPIVMTSRTERTQNKVLSVAICCYLSECK